jgi:ADP-ribose pyrophosphatase
MSDEDVHLREEPVARTELLKGHFLHVVRDTVRLPSGREATREYVLHPGAVMVIGLLDDGRVVHGAPVPPPHAQRHDRVPGRQARCRRRQSGLCAARASGRNRLPGPEWAFAGRLAPTIAYSDEIIDIWFARGLSRASAGSTRASSSTCFSARPTKLLGVVPRRQPSSTARPWSAPSGCRTCCRARGHSTGPGACTATVQRFTGTGRADRARAGCAGRPR